jgi:hypothetical protein
MHLPTLDPSVPIMHSHRSLAIKIRDIDSRCDFNSE